MFKGSGGDRRTVTNSMVLITDGGAHVDQALVTNAGRVRDLAHVVAVGVTPGAAPSLLTSVASDASNVFNVNSFQ